MSKATVTISDLSNSLVEAGNEVTVIVRSHPMLTQPVKLDAALPELKSVMQDTGEYVIIEVTKDGETKQAVVELSAFNLLFKDDAYAVLQNAEPVKVSRASNGANKGELELIRTWARQNGYDVKDKGRIKQNVVDAYRSDNAA